MSENKDFTMGLNPILNTQNTYLKNALFKPKEEIFTGYHRSALPIAFRRDYYRKEYDMKSLYKIDLSEAFRMLFVAKTRTGKSFWIRAMVDRLKKAGFCIVYLTDVKNEYDTSIRPLQAKFASKLIRGEKPEGTKLKVFKPTFFQYLEGDARLLPAGQEWCSMDLSKLQPRDFSTMLKFLGLTQQQIDGMERALYEAKQRGFIIKGWEDFENILNDADYIQNSGQILTKLFKIQYYNPFDVNHRINPSEYLAQGYTLVLNLQYYDNLERSNGFMQVTVANWMRNIKDARKSKKIPPVVFIVDETPRFCSSGVGDGAGVTSDTVSKFEIMESVDTDTAYDINWVFAGQDIVSIPERVVKQCRYIMIPQNIAFETAKSAMKIANLENVEVKSTQFNELRRLLSPMKQRDWMVLDTNMKSYIYVTSLAPLTEVKETSHE